MADYKEMYLKMFRASEQAINILIAAQQECEEQYISSSPTELKIVAAEENTKDKEEELSPALSDKSTLL